MNLNLAALFASTYLFAFSAPVALDKADVAKIVRSAAEGLGCEDQDVWAGLRQIAQQKPPRRVAARALPVDLERTTVVEAREERQRFSGDAAGNWPQRDSNPCFAVVTFSPKKPRSWDC